MGCVLRSTCICTRISLQLFTKVNRVVPPSSTAEKIRHSCALRHYFYIPRHIKLYIEYDFNYMKGAKRRTDVMVPPLVVQWVYRSHASVLLIILVGHVIVQGQGHMVVN